MTSDTSMELPVNYEKTHYTRRKLIREEYARRQDGLCCYCKAPLDGRASKVVRGKSVNRKLAPKNFFKWPVHLQHCHNTGMTIGAVHAYCNAVLWQYEGK